MRIGIDARPITWHQRSGMARYIFNLLKELANLDQKNTYLIYLNRYQEIKSIRNKSNFQMRIIPAPFLLYKFFLLPFYLVKDKIDLFHSLTPELPFWCPCKTVVTIYDLNFELFPKLYGFKVQLLSRLKLARRAINKAEQVIAISQNTKKDIISFYQPSPTKIKVISLATDNVFRPSNKQQARKIIREKYNIDQKFILYVGQIREQKNITRLLKAYRDLKRSEMFSHKLILIGLSLVDSKYYDLPKKLQELNLQDEVYYISSFLEDSDLAVFYQAADLFIYPSIYEGFGLPPLEAMACGTPVVASRISSLPEVLGEAAILVNPYDVGAFFQVMKKVLLDRHLREKLVVQGLKRVKMFSWQKVAKETLFVYRSCFKNVS